MEDEERGNVFWRWCKRLWHGGSVKGQWDGNKMNSRKFLVMMTVAAIVVSTCYILVARLRVYQSSIAEEGLRQLGAVAIAYFGCNVLEHGLRVYDRVKNGTKNGGSHE